MSHHEHQSCIEACVRCAQECEHCGHECLGMSDTATGRISPDTVNALNRLGDQVQQQTGAQLIVVVV